jgi:hypothetical protein
MAILQGNGVRAFLEVIHRGMQVFEMASGRKEELAEVEKDKEKVRCGEEEKRPCEKSEPIVAVLANGLPQRSVDAGHLLSKAGPLRGNRTHSQTAFLISTSWNCRVTIPAVL